MLYSLPLSILLHCLCLLLPLLWTPVATAVEPFPYAFGENGWRKSTNDTRSDLLLIQTNQYGFAFGKEHISSPRVGRISGYDGYESAIGVGNQNDAESQVSSGHSQLPPAKLKPKIKIDNRIYSATTFAASLTKSPNLFATARMRESGRFVQHFDFLKLDFQDETGESLKVQPDVQVDLITPPRNAVHCYGPHKAFRQHLKQNPSSWKTTHREAVGNDLAVEVTGGRLMQSYPIFISAKLPKATWTMKGRVGEIPVQIANDNSPTRFESKRAVDGVESSSDQSVNRSDFWQIDEGEVEGTFPDTFNLPADGDQQTRVFQEVRTGKAKTGKEAKAAFNHPGISHRAQQIEFVKAKIAAGDQPWANAWKQLQQHPRATLTYRPQPFAHVERGPWNDPNIGSSDFSGDANAAYLHAIQWVIGGNVSHAEKAAEILDAWSGTLKSVSNHDAQLLIGMEGYEFCNAAELLKHAWDGWPVESQKRFSRMLREIFYPIIKDFFPSANGNWDASMIQTMMAMGVYLDDRAMFDRGRTYFLNGKGNGAVGNYFKPSGQCQESGRDQNHTQMGLDFLACAAEIGWNQGLDLYSAVDDRLLKGFEYTARYNLDFDVPYEPYRSYKGRYFYKSISDQGRGRLRPMYEKVYNHYHKRQGLPAPFTEKAVMKIRAAANDDRSRRRRSSALETLMFAPER